MTTTVTRDVKRAQDSLKALIHEPTLLKLELKEVGEDVPRRHWVLTASLPGEPEKGSVLILAVDEYPDATDEQLAAFMFGMIRSNLTRTY